MAGFFTPGLWEMPAQLLQHFRGNLIAVSPASHGTQSLTLHLGQIMLLQNAEESISKGAAAAIEDFEALGCRVLVDLGEPSGSVTSFARLVRLLFSANLFLCTPWSLPIAG